MMRIAMRAFCVLAFVAGTSCAHAQSGSARDTLDSVRAPWDSSEISLRLPQQSRVDELRADDEFDYGAVYRQPESLWTVVMRAIAEWFRRLVGSNQATVWDIVGYIVLGAAIILVAMKLYGVDIARVFFRSRTEADASDAATAEDVHGIDYDARITAALDAEDFRMAVRLHYLRALRDLSDAGAIVWRRNKTDSDYVRELAGSPQQSDFERAALLFEYVWYGGFPIDRDGYQRIAAAIDRVAVPGTIAGQRV